VKTVVGQGTFHWTPLISADVRFSVEKLSRTGVAALPKSESLSNSGAAQDHFCKPGQPHASSHRRSEQCGEQRPPMTRVLKSWFFGCGLVFAGVNQTDP
jgi:hypothetical protein